MAKQRASLPEPATELVGELGELEIFMRTFGAFVERAQQLTDPKLRLAETILQTHLGDDAVNQPIVTETFSPWDHINVARGLQLLEQEVLDLTWHGLIGDLRYSDLNLASMIVGGRWSNNQVGPLVHRNQPSGVDAHEACISFGFAVGTYRSHTVALLLRLGEPHGPLGNSVRLEIVANEREISENLLSELRKAMDHENVYRGQMLSFTVCDDGSLQINFLKRTAVKRTEIVMPKGVLESVEQHVVGIAKHRDELRALGQHLKRGVLLHGAPGAGKTMTVRYLASHLVDTTVIVLTGVGLRAITPSCQMARALAPALVVIEDVDLIANERHQEGHETNPLLFALLNEMDGIDGDADVAFILTTNRADLLEPALAQRPGRVDLAVEVPLPNAACRRRLIRQYAKPLGLTFADSTELGELIERTNGVAASFIKELLRRAVVNALHANEQVNERHVSGALDQLTSATDALTRSLLGSTTK
jgi:cell division protease FtsH